MLLLPENCSPPSGYRWGSHWSEPNRSGWWVIREVDGEGVQAETRPDLVEIDDEEDEADAGGMTADDIEETIKFAFSVHDEERRESLDLVLVEVMPKSLRAIHTAAHNRGRYPFNGASRFLVPRKIADNLVDDWTTVVRDSGPSDMENYPVDLTGEQTAQS